MSKLPLFNGVSVSKIEIAQNGDMSVEFDLPTPVDLQTNMWRTDIMGKRTFDMYEDPELMAAAQALFRIVQQRVMEPDTSRVDISCSKCTESSCCREYDVFLEKEDVARLGTHLGLSEAELVAKHIDENPDWSGDYHHRLRRVPDGDGHRCTFLLRDDKSGRMRCSIYEGRPNLCRSFDERDCTLYDGE